MYTKIFIEVSKLNFKQVLLEKELKQNYYDLQHRNKYEKYCYHLVLSSSGRRDYLKGFLYFY